MQSNATSNTRPLTPPDPAFKGAPPWPILVVDDDDSILQLTKLVLGRIKVMERPLSLTFARTSAEARLLCEQKTFAVAIVDVVMETDRAGLDFVAWLRTLPHAVATRLVIRTGQPGMAPEDYVLQNFDINDYWPKTELSAQRIRTVITGLIRSYAELERLEQQRQDLSLVVRTMPELLNQQNASRLLASLGKAIDHLFGTEGSTLHFLQHVSGGLGEAHILASTDDAGRSRPFKLSDRVSPKALALLHESALTGRVVIQDLHAVLLVHQASGRALAVVGEGWSFTDDWSCEIAELLIRNALEFLDNLLTQSQHLTDLERQLRHDPLTGLSNRLGLLEHLELALQKDACVALLLIQLDQLDAVRAAYGEGLGDLVVQGVAERLAQLPRQLLVSRLDSDHFALALGPGPTGVGAVVSSIERIFERPFPVAESMLRLTLHQGIALASKQTPTELLRQAELALKGAIRQDGPRSAFFDPSWAAADIRSAQLQTEIQQAELEREFYVLFQPILSLKDGQIQGAEALLRWNSQRFGPVSPAEFIPLAEHAGIIDALTRLVLRRALDALDVWRQVHPPMYVSVNISALSLGKPGFVAMILSALARRDSSGLYLELTENERLAHDQVSRQQMQALRARGIRFMIDDFGTGYSSLSYLHKLPVDAMKIDHGFVSQLTDDTDNPHRRLMEAILGVADSLQIPVVAEGIETPIQAEILSKLRCKNGQGYLYSRPVPADSILEMLTRQAEAMDDVVR